jgi:hypothetical protein
MRNTLAIGAITEGRVLAALLGAGHAVAVPFGVARYDLIVDMDGSLLRVQCKTGRLRNGVVVFKPRSVQRNNFQSFDHVPYQGFADVFGVFCPDNDKVYLVPVDDCVSEIKLRVDPLRTPQRARIRFAKDYEVRPGHMESEPVRVPGLAANECAP